MESQSPKTLWLIGGVILCLGLAHLQAASIALPLPLYFESFDAVAEGSLPQGWHQISYSDLTRTNQDLRDLDSALYAGWLVVDRSRFTSNFLGYASHIPVDYSRVLSFNPNNVVNGQTVTNLATGRFLFCTSGWREGNQVMYLFSPDYDLSGTTNIYVSFHSLYEQNQDSLGALEYSVDAGQHWLPIVYMLDRPDVLTAAGGGVDAVATFTNRYSDVAVYADPVTHKLQGGYYGAFIAAPIGQELAPFISARIDDDPVESKRVELCRLPMADNRPAVRFRFALAGADSWYWGIDDFGIYSITPGELPVIVAGPSSVTLTSGLTATFAVTATGTAPLTYQWKFNGAVIPGATNRTLVIGSVGTANQGSYTVLVSNKAGAVESAGAVLSIHELVVTGQWDFDRGDLVATVGADLECVENAVSPATFSAMEISGRPAGVMGFGGDSSSPGFYMRHGAKPNGGGHFVNQYTLLMDVMYPRQSGGPPGPLLQTDPFNHDGDPAEFYVGDDTSLPDPNGLGAEGEYNGTLSPETWYRIALAVDLTAPPGQHLTKYINGVSVGHQSLSGGVDGLYALGPTALLFTSGKNPGGPTKPGFVNSIQFVNGWMPPEAIAALGGPSASGLPPGNAALRLTVARQTDVLVHLSWTGPAGPFEVQRSGTLQNPGWESIGTSSNHSFVVSAGTSTAFFRVKSLQPDIQVGQLPENEQSIPSKEILRAAGQQLQFAGRPVDLALSPDGRRIYIKNISSLVVVDAESWSVLQTLAYPASGASMHGIAVSQNGAHVYVTGAANELYDWNVGTNGTVSFSRTLSLPNGADPCGIALSPDGAGAYVCLSVKNTLAVIDLPSGRLAKEIPVGIAPWDVVLSLDGNTAYVSDWGGRLPRPGDPTGPSAGTQVVVDNRGVGASGVVSFVDLVTGLESAQVVAGLHPSDVELSGDGRILYVANANSDTISVIDVPARAVRESILVKPDPTFPYGTTVDGLALSKDGRFLFAAAAGNNAIGVVELPNAAHATSLVQGFLPTDWYPGALAVDSNYLYVVNVKGLGSRLGQPVTSSWQIGAHLGTANKIPIPSADALSKYTAQVQENGRVPQIRQTRQLPEPGKVPVPVPVHVGEPSVFQHVLYILKENKTYDQVLGDIPQGNGNVNLCIYPQFVSPNHHALALQYVLLDNFYCNGVNSADGHSWSTEGYTTDHLEKSFGGFSRSYTFGDDALTYSSSGFLWNNVLEHGLTFRNYGEMDYASPWPSSATWLQIYSDYTNHAGKIHFAQNIGLAPLRPYSSTNVPGWNLGIPDVVRADGFIKELNAAQSSGVWAALHLLYLPNDHTGGPPTPRAQVADNDLALGQVVEAVTKSVFATNTVIFVIEDDPQSGYDHVDGHRSLCLVISPYTKRGQVISTFYNQAGVLHTIEQILGLPPMNQHDAMAPLMFDCFTHVPNFAPYTALPNNVPLTEGTTVTGSLSRKQRYWAKKLQSMDFSRPDRINDNVFNRYIWYTIKGEARYPAEFVGGHGKGLKPLGLVLDKTQGDRDDDDDEPRKVTQHQGLRKSFPRCYDSLDALRLESRRVPPGGA